jgi:hypothetical protein
MPIRISYQFIIYYIKLKTLQSLINYKTKTQKDFYLIVVIEVVVGLPELLLIPDTQNSASERLDPDIAILCPRQTAVVVTLELGAVLDKKIEEVNSCVTSVPKQHNVEKSAIVELVALRVEKMLVLGFAMSPKEVGETLVVATSTQVPEVNKLGRSLVGPVLDGLDYLAKRHFLHVVVNLDSIDNLSHFFSL